MKFSHECYDFIIKYFNAFKENAGYPYVQTTNRAHEDKDEEQQQYKNSASVSNILERCSSAELLLTDSRIVPEFEHFC